MESETKSIIQDENRTYNPVYEAYRALLEVFNDPAADFTDQAIAIEEAIGYLGEALA